MLLNMDGETTKYYFYKERGSGNLTIPVRIAKALDWNHKDDITLLIKSIDGKVGLFLTKE